MISNCDKMQVIEKDNFTLQITFSFASNNMNTKLIHTIYFHIPEPDIQFTCTDNLFFYKKRKLLFQQYKYTPSCQLDKLQITVSGIL